MAAVLFRCPHCRAWRVWGWVLRRTADTDTCHACDYEGWKAAVYARGHAQIESMRQWLLAAPLYTDDLLLAAQSDDRGPTRGPRREGLPNSWPDLWYHIRRLKSWDGPWDHPVPWVDTMDPDVAAEFLHSAVSAFHPWPPATVAARLRLRDSPESNPAIRLDIGAAFGQRGFPFPPDTTRRHYVMYDDDRFVEEVGYSGIEVLASLSHLRAAGRAGGTTEVVALLNSLSGGEYSRSGTAGAEVLPADYADVLELDLRLKPAHPAIDPGGYDRWDQGAPLWAAVGSVYRDDQGHVVVLWR